MRTLREIRPDYAVIDVKTPASAVVLILPLLLAAAILPWVAPQSPPGRWISTLFVCVSCLGALFVLRGRRERFALAGTAQLRFEPLPESDDPEYRVVLVRGERRETLLRHVDVAVLIRDLQHVAETTRLPIENRCGLPTEYFTRMSHSLASAPEPASVVGAPSPSHERAARAALGAVAFASLVFGWCILKARSELSPLSVLVPSLGIIALGLLGLWLLTWRVQVTVSEHGVRVERVALGVRNLQLEIPRHELSGARAFGHGPNILRLVLFATTRGPFVTALAGNAAKRVADAVGFGSASVQTPNKIDRDALPRDAARSGSREATSAARDSSADARREAIRSVASEVARARQS